MKKESVLPEIVPANREEIVYSIIIPHKNIPDLLWRCLDSISQRPDIQIIVVDDNSSSDKVDFAHFPGREREEVEIVYTHEGLGAGYARNVGLGHARGRWLLFADADDYFLPDFLEMADRYKDSDLDLIVFRAESADSESLEPMRPRQRCHDDLSENVDWERIRFRIYAPWAKMISRRFQVARQLSFEEIPVANDMMFSVYTDYYACRVAVCSGSIYCATVRQGSLEYGLVLDHLLLRVSKSCRLNHFLRKQGVVDRYSGSFTYVHACKTGFGRKEYYKALWIYVREERPELVLRTFKNLLRDKVKQIFK